SRIFGHDVAIRWAPDLPESLLWGLIIVSILLFVTSAILGFLRYFDDRRERARRLVLVVEQRGLRSGAGDPLVGAVPSSIKGRRQELLLDLRDRVKDGEICNPEIAVERVSQLTALLEPHRAS